MKVTQDNFRDYVGKRVHVEVSCYEGAFMAPDYNTLIGFINNEWVFTSPEIEAPVKGPAKHMWSIAEIEGSLAVEIKLYANITEIIEHNNKTKQLEAEKADLVKWLRHKKKSAYNTACECSAEIQDYEKASQNFGASAAYVKVLNFINNQNKQNG